MVCFKRIFTEGQTTPSTLTLVTEKCKNIQREKRERDCSMHIYKCWWYLISSIWSEVFLSFSVYDLHLEFYICNAKFIICMWEIKHCGDWWCFHTRARQRQDNDKTNVEPVHSYDAFHTRHVGPGVKGIIGMHRFNICLVVVLSLSCSGVKTPLVPLKMMWVVSILHWYVNDCYLNIYVASLSQRVTYYM